MPKGLANVCRGYGGSGKKRVKSNGSTGKKSTRELYGIFFKAYGILPGELAKQSPVILFKMLDVTEDEKRKEIPKGYEFFYGL